MVNLTIRKNDHCIIGLPACGYVFSSTKSCFIGYGFKASSFEKEILLSILQENGIEPVEAGGNFQPGKYAFCHKICSKIITSQFCIVILNNDTEMLDGRTVEKPNANVNMEYGLMLGHNKFVIPLQRDDQALPFNVSGLDTLKYNNQNFAALARKAIAQAVAETTQTAGNTAPTNEMLETYLMSRGLLVTALESQFDKDFYRLGQPAGFNLLNTFDGMSYVFLGNFMQFDAAAIIWRIGKLYEVISARLSSLDAREKLGGVSPQQLAVINLVRSTLKVLIFVTGKAQLEAVNAWLEENPAAIPTEIVTLEDIRTSLERTT